MAEIVRMPKLSDTMTDGVIAKWHKKVGDKVKVITGTNKGTIGTINSILFKKSNLFIEEI